MNNPKPAPDKPEGVARVESSALLECEQRLERYSENEQTMVDACVAREEYGNAEYHKGKAHAFALACLTIRRLLKHSNDPS